MGFITDLFNHYGYIAIFGALTLELIGFPTPGEALMTYCGFLVFQGRLNFGISIIVASLGVICGITASYFIGLCLGTPFFEKYGARIHMGKDRIEKTSKWFGKYGNGLLVIAYFIPGVRHITGYFSGITKIPFKRFATNAYIGAIIWTSTFISLGKVLGSNWEKYHIAIKKYLIIIGIVTAIILIFIYLIKSYKEQIEEFIVSSLVNSTIIFHSLGTIRIAMVGVAASFIALSILVGGLIQDFLGNEFTKFDTIVAFLISLIFSKGWTTTMKIFELFSSYQILISIIILVFIWIVIKGKNRLLEISFLLISTLGAEILEETLRRIFHRQNPLWFYTLSNPSYTFPSEQSLLAIVVYGFATFMIIRHIKRKWIGTIIIPLALAICLSNGISILFFKLEYPSDIIAGYAFGGVWLCLCILLMEIYRILPAIKKTQTV